VPQYIDANFEVHQGCKISIRSFIIDFSLIYVFSDEISTFNLFNFFISSVKK